jgi:polar amino acid transport system substrate-binding protein
MKRQALSFAVVLALAACSSGQPSATPSTTPPDCRPGTLQTKTAGTLTWATDRRAEAPWVVGDPALGQGFEAAVASAVTERLGFTQDQTTWIDGAFDAILAPGPKDFDIALDQIAITPERGTTVDFSPAYYDVRHVVIALDRSSVATADLAGLRTAKIGALKNSAALAALTTKIAPATGPVVFNSSNEAKLALIGGEIDALVVSLPNGYHLTTVELKASRIVGSLPQSTAEPERFGMALQLGSPLTPCVAQAVEELRRDGTLEKLEATWLANTAAPPL